MGNKEALLAGAKRCLYEKGYARTTVRDLASAANVSMAAIGYHFGSREALLNTALIEANEEWGETLASVLQVETPASASPAQPSPSGFTATASRRRSSSAVPSCATAATRSTSAARRCGFSTGWACWRRSKRPRPGWVR